MTNEWSRVDDGDCQPFAIVAGEEYAQDKGDDVYSDECIIDHAGAYVVVETGAQIMHNACCGQNECEGVSEYVVECDAFYV